MMRTIIFGAVACCLSLPAQAGERGLKPLPADAAALLVKDRGAAAPARRSFVSIELREHPAVVTNVEIGPQPLPPRFALAELRAQRAWRVTDALPQITAERGGSWAVRDSFAAERKPRAYRPSAMTTMLFLKLDGNDESPSFGVRGGGVSGALWAVVPHE